MLFRRKSSPKIARDCLAEHPPIRLKQCRHGLFMYNMHDKYIGRSLDMYGEVFELEAALFHTIIKPGMLVLDIGANIGTHTVSLAKSVTNTGKVIALEPQHVIYQMLCGNVALNGLENVTALWAAAGEKPGFIHVPHVDYNAEGNFGGLSLIGQHSGEAIPIQVIDALALPRCDFIKIDVEGMELDVLKGAKKTLQKFKPVLYVENDRIEKSESLIRHLLDSNYRLFWHMPALYNPGNYFGEKKDIFSKNGAAIVSVNMLGIHRDSNGPLPPNAIEITAQTAHKHPHR